MKSVKILIKKRLYELIKRLLRIFGLDDILKEKIKNTIMHLKSPSGVLEGYEIIESIWRAEGATDELLDYLTLLEQSPVVWKNANHKIWLIYLSSLIERGIDVKAEIVLRKYIKYHGLKDIDKYLLVAKFANQRNITDENIKKAAYIFDKLEENKNKKIFENLIAGKSIAIVGNGPSEIGKGKGKEIDSHDIVIRFNNYVTDGFEKDYGSKTDIWVRGSGASDVVDRDISRYKLVIWEADYWHFPIHSNHADYLYRDLKNNITPVMYFDYHTHLELRHSSLIAFPTTGLVTCWGIYRQKNIVQKINLYGFSFLQEKVDGISTHYFNDRDLEEAKNRSIVHDLFSESNFLNELFREL